MANIKSNKKSAERAKKDRQIHKSERSFLKNRIKEAKTSGDATKFNLAVKTIDSKAAKGLIKKQTANRMKSKLALAINKQNQPTEA